MQYQVPQFVEVENKIVGPLTLRQFFYLAAGFLASFLAFFVLKFFVWVIFAIIAGGIAASFAFIRYNSRPFSLLIRSVFSYFWNPRKYIWQKTSLQAPSGREGINDLNLKLNTSSRPIGREKPFGLSFLGRLRTAKERYEVFRKITGEREVARRVDFR